MARVDGMNQAQQQQKRCNDTDKDIRPKSKSSQQPTQRLSDPTWLDIHKQRPRRHHTCVRGGAAYRHQVPDRLLPA